MSRMIRKQVYLDQRHERMLKRRAKRRGVTEAEIIREALDNAARGVARPTNRPASVDSAAAQTALAFMRSLAVRRSKGPAGRTWTREALYEDRIGRWVKS